MKARAMKPSGIPWVGDIPKDWEVTRLQWHLEEVNEGNTPVKSTFVLSLTNDRGVIPYAEKGNQGNKAKNDVSGYKLAYKDCIIANSMNIIIGSVGISQYDGCVSPVYYVFRAKGSADIKFLNYIFQTSIFQRELRRYAKGILEIRLRISADSILKRPVPFPELLEQKRIVAFLDKATGRIDGLREKITKEIERLGEYKKSLIAEAVCGRVGSPREMKPSGIPWVGDIPKDWEVSPLYKYMAQVKNLNTGMRERNLLSLSYGKIKRKNIETVTGLIPTSYEGYNIIEEGDIVLRLTDLQNDKRSIRVGRATERGIVTSAYVTIRPSKECLSEYLAYAILVFDIKKGFYGIGSGVRQGLSYDEIKKLKFLFPPLPEQKRIAKYLNKATEKIDALVEKRKVQLEKLDALKKSIVCEYVTGKKEVAA